MSGPLYPPVKRWTFNSRETPPMNRSSPQVSEAMLDAGRSVAIERKAILDNADLSAIYLAMQSARTPSDETAQQQHGSPEPTAITSTGRLDAGASATPSETAWDQPDSRVSEEPSDQGVGDTGVGEAEREVVARALCKVAGDHWFASESLVKHNGKWRMSADAAILAMRSAQNTVPSGKDMSDEVNIDKVSALAIMHCRKYSTPKADDPRRQYTLAQVEIAIRKAADLLHRISGGVDTNPDLE